MAKDTHPPLWRFLGKCGVQPFGNSYDSLIGVGLGSHFRFGCQGACFRFGARTRAFIQSGAWGCH